jgi:hypothetical protein
MTRRKRGCLIFGAVVGALATAEVGLNRLRGPEGCVEVQNAGSTPIEDLVVTYGANRAKVQRIAPGGSEKVYLAGRGVHTLVLRYKQKGNALNTYELPGFDAGMLSREGQRQVLRMQTNAVERYLDDAEPTTPGTTVLQNWWNSLGDSIEDQVQPK